MRLLNHNLGPWRAQYSLKGLFKRTAQIWYLTLNNLPRYSTLIPYTDYRLQTLTWLIPVTRKWGIRLRMQYSERSFDHIPEEISAKFCCKSLVTWLLNHHRDVLFPAEFSRYCNAMNAKISDLRSVFHYSSSRIQSMEHAQITKQQFARRIVPIGHVVHLEYCISNFKFIECFLGQL